MKKIVWLALLIVTSGCALTKVGVIEGDLPDPFRNYAAPFDRTWEATVDVMQRYPIVTIDKSSGLLITDQIEAISDLYYEYEEGSNERHMLKDRIKYNIKVTPLPTGGTRVTINQFVKLYVPGPGVHSSVAQFLSAGQPEQQKVVNYEWKDLSAIKDLPAKTSSPRVKEILDAIESKLKE